MKQLMNWGGILGLALIAYSLVLYALGATESQAAQYVSYGIIAAGIFLATKNKRDKQNGIISYGEGLGYGVGVAFFGSILVAFYTFIFFSMIDPEMLEQMVLRAEDQMYEQGLPDDQVEMAMEMTRKFMMPGPMAAIVVLSYTFVGFIISLITSAILKKEGDPFASVSSDSDDN
ncbi:MAG: DUF4199 domain-containing protein [Flavobacteriales bacterium]|nr:DUF4199 domain-containing protein [Flavobacteriales bacterium]